MKLRASLALGLLLAPLSAVAQDAMATVALAAETIEAARPPRAFDFVVAGDGSGDFASVQEAVDAAPDGSVRRTVILVKTGVYKGHLVISPRKINLSLVGENAEKTLLTNDLHVKSPGADGREVGTIGSASVVVSADGFRAENVGSPGTELEFAL